MAHHQSFRFAFRRTPGPASSSSSMNMTPAFSRARRQPSHCHQLRAQSTLARNARSRPRTRRPSRPSPSASSSPGHGRLEVGVASALAKPTRGPIGNSQLYYVQSVYKYVLDVLNSYCSLCARRRSRAIPIGYHGSHRSPVRRPDPGGRGLHAAASPARAVRRAVPALGELRRDPARCAEVRRTGRVADTAPRRMTQRSWHRHQGKRATMWGRCGAARTGLSRQPRPPTADVTAWPTIVDR